MGNPPSPPTPLLHCGRGANLRQVYRVMMLSEVCIAHIFCPPLNHKGRRGSSDVLMLETEDGTQGLPQKPHPVSLRASDAKPACAERELQLGYRLSAIGYRLSTLGYRLSALGYRLSAIDSRLR
jgi:hypothetical protein